MWVVDADNGVQPFTLGKLFGDDKRNRDLINDRLVLLPPGLGGLSEAGFLDEGAATRPGLDVADQWLGEDGQPRRRREVNADKPDPAGMRLIRCIHLLAGEDADDEIELAEVAALSWWWYEKTRGADGEGSGQAKQDVLLTDHTRQVADYADRIVRKLKLPMDLATAVRLAAGFHDLGKDRSRWQQKIGNPDPGRPLAKAGRRRKSRDFGFLYRHEFGSLLDVLKARGLNEAARQEFAALSDEVRELTLHLIAAHHGRARPHFAPEEVDDLRHPKAHSDAVAAETPRRFARLQRRYGRWGLAFLESLLRAADYAASANPDGTPEKIP